MGGDGGRDQGQDQDLDERVRQAALLLSLRANPALRLREEIAREADVDVAVVADRLPDSETATLFLLEPLIRATDEILRDTPIHHSPTPGHQREVLAALLDVSVRHPLQQAYSICLLAGGTTDCAASRRSEVFMKQAGLRLLGATYETDPEAMLRVRMVTHLIRTIGATEPHRPITEEERAVVVEGLVSILNPIRPDAGGPRPPSRHWPGDARP